MVVLDAIAREVYYRLAHDFDGRLRKAVTHADPAREAGEDYHRVDPHSHCPSTRTEAVADLG